MSSLKEEKKSSKEELSPPDYQKSDLEKSDDEVGLEMSTRLDAVGVDGVYERKVSLQKAMKENGRVVLHGSIRSVEIVG